MREFIIRRKDGDILDLPPDKLPALLYPGSVAYEIVSGSWPGMVTLRIAGATVTMIEEMPGLAVTFEDDGAIDDVLANKVVAEIGQNMNDATGVRHVVLEMPRDKPFRFA